MNSHPVPINCGCGKPMNWHNITIHERDRADNFKIEPMWCCPDYAWRANPDGHLNLFLKDVLVRPRSCQR